MHLWLDASPELAGEARAKARIGSDELRELATSAVYGNLYHLLHESRRDADDFRRGYSAEEFAAIDWDAVRGVLLRPWEPNDIFTRAKGDVFSAGQRTPGAAELP